jgi:hypothetical protein
MKTIAGLKPSIPAGKFTRHRLCCGLVQHGSSTANDVTAVGWLGWRGG